MKTGQSRDVEAGESRESYTSRPVNSSWPVAPNRPRGLRLRKPRVAAAYTNPPSPHTYLAARRAVPGSQDGTGVLIEEGTKT